MLSIILCSRISITNNFTESSNDNKKAKTKAAFSFGSAQSDKMGQRSV